ncbi:MAG: prolyl oligopeptidase family serine peptidase [Rhodothermales bacterium]
MTIRYAIPLALLLIAGCDTMSPGDERVIGGVDLDVLFAPATPAEIAEAEATWAARDVAAAGLAILRQDTIQITPGAQSVLYVISHVLDGTHYAAVAVPVGATDPLPVFMYAHAGDEGVSIDETIPLLSLGVNQLIDQFIFVVPSFRGEPLIYDGVALTSTGAPSPLDRDVDDALALLDALPAVTPVADTSRIGLLGFSRGAGVAMLMGARRPGIDAISAFFGPTDFFGPYVQDIFSDALRGTPRDLPGFDHLNATYIQPLKAGQLTIADVRPELVRRSPVLFAGKMPALQIQHGTADQTVDVSQAQAMIDAMTALGRTSPDFEYFLYPGAGHNPIEMIGSFDRVVAFFGEWFGDE